MKKYKITHLISAEFEATAIVNEDEIDEKTNDLKAYKKPDSKFNFTMLKGTEAITSSISGSSRTYTASPFLVGGSSFEEQTDITKTTLSLSLSGADQTFISTVLNENVVNDTVEIYRGLLDSNNSIIADPILLYSGNIDTFEIAETETQSNVKLIIVSHWADFDKKSGRKTNNASQQRFFSTDVGMDYSSETVLDIKWGRE